ncbi:MAG: diguanylate cyclase [Vicinamibacterales bacterium]
MSTSFSAGVATFPADATTSSELLRTADLALYRAKSEGRDRVVVGVSSASPSP